MELRIPGSDMNSVSKTYKSEATKTGKVSTGQTDASGNTDSVALSQDAEQTLAITKAAEAKAKELPDVRENLVASLREQVESGQYQVQPDQVALNMLNDLSNGNGDE